MDALILRDVSHQVWIACLAASGALSALYFACAAWRHRRNQPRADDPPGTVRVRGRVRGASGGDPSPDDVQPTDVIYVDRRGQRYRVSLARAALRRRPAAGERVIVDGALRVVPRGDTLYREPARWVGLDAHRVIVEASALRWLRLPVALACLLWLFSLAQLVFAPQPTGRLFDTSPAPERSTCDRPCAPPR